MRLSWIVIALLAGCGRIGFDDLGGGGPGGSGNGDGGGGGDDGASQGSGDGGTVDSGPNVYACAGDLGSAMGNFVTGGATTAQIPSNFSSCNGAGEPDTAYEWTAPSDGTFTFDLCASAGNFDSVLYVLTDCNSVAPIACDDNTCPDGVNARTSVGMVQGQHVVIVVDGNMNASNPNFPVGNYTLGIH